MLNPHSQRLREFVRQLNFMTGYLTNLAIVFDDRLGPPRSPKPRREFNIDMELRREAQAVNFLRSKGWHVEAGSKDSPASAASGRPIPTRGSNARATTRSKRGTRKG